MTTEGQAPPGLRGGTLDRTPLAALFKTLYSERATGQVLISHRAEERTFWFDRGQLVSAASNHEAQLVGELLRTFGLADESVLFTAFERALTDPGRGLSRALSETGAVPAFVADACVRALAERILYDSFRWSGGAWTVTPLEKPPELPVRFDRSNANLILEGYRRLPSDAPIPGPPVEPRARPILPSDLLMRYQWAALLPDEADVLGKVDGQKAAADVSVDLRILARLEAAGLINLVRPGKLASDREGPEGLAALNIEIAGANPSARAAELGESQATLVWNTYRRIDWASFYEILGIQKEASNEDVLRALHERAKAFHPDLHHRTNLADARDALEALFRKILAVEKAFETPESRAAYDRALAAGGQSVAVASQGPTPEVQRQVARANYLRARTLFEQEDYYPAYEMVKQSVEFDPDKNEYWILLSRIQRKNPKWVRHSAETMRRAAERTPESAELWFEFSEACVAARNEADRVKALKEVLRIDPANRRAQSALAEIASMKPGR